MTEILLRIAGFLLGSRSLGSLMNSHGKLKILKFDERLHLIQDARFYLNRLNNMSYQQIGDFRKDLTFINFSQYFSKNLRFEIMSFIPFGQLPQKDYSNIESNEAQLKRILVEMSTEIAKLEHKWLRK